ncbi:MAG: hypothetical protein AMJ58_08545 [Gammaproteobacteria bacterium SG8_30]|jgi:L-histidine N-alpha-methyltransferase|nr:MAG: hypothetical protein AMJ58_08545 [Gammaproteobacteria bacterium SG8_30]
MKQPSVAFDTRREQEARQARVEEVLAGLREDPPRISPIWFYDRRGSLLFEKICELPEYYPTRTELGIMRVHAADMAALLGPRVALVEPGSGASLKTRLLLDALDRPAAYVPVDISGGHLMDAARALRQDYPSLRVEPVCADFTRPFSLPAAPLRATRRRIVYFPGSTIGNFPRDEAIELLARLRGIAGEDGALLLGVDRVKPKAVMERAYDDAAGVTAEFNLNALLHLNRELGTDFDPSAFGHRAPWVAEHSRIEMHLVARRDTTFSLDGESFGLARGDYLLTEYSHKYTLEDATAKAAAAGLTLRRAWSDPNEWFSVLLFEPA